MRLVLILALGWAVLALPASADYHDDDGYNGDEGYEDTFDEAPPPDIWRFAVDKVMSLNGPGTRVT